MKIFNTRSDAIAASIASEETSVQTFGYDSLFDRGGSTYARVNSAPSHPGCFQSADCSYWEMIDDFPTIEAFGGFTGLGNDCTPALNDLNSYLVATGRRRIRVGYGNYYFNSKPNDFLEGIQIIGEGRSSSKFNRNYSPATSAEGFLTWRATVGGNNCLGGRLKGVTLRAIAGTQGVMLRNVTEGPVSGHFTLEDSVITYGTRAAYTRAWFVKGTANTTPGGIGYRDVNVTQAYFFLPPGQIETVRFSGVTNIHGDFWSNGQLVITGSDQVPSTYAILHIEVGANVFISNADLIVTTGSLNNLIHSTGTSRCRHYGSTPAGGYANLGAASNALV
jgi:hypothetical protein